MMGTRNALVLGGTGLVGQYLVPRLVGQGFDVDIVSRGESGVIGGEPNVRLINADLQNPDWIEFAGLRLERYDVIYHLAYAVGPDEARNRAVTVDSVGLLLEGLSGISVQRKRHFVYVGSMAVFGVRPADEVVTESSRRNADSEYAENKLAATNLAMTPVRGVVCTVLHPTGVYDEKSSRINKYRKLLSANYVPALPKLGMNNIVHADDVANALVLCLDRGLEENAEYIINGESVSFRDWFSCLESTVESRCRLRLPEAFRFICRGPIRNLLNRLHICCPIYFSNRMDSPLFKESVFSSNRAFEDFGYRSMYSFKETFSKQRN